MPGDADGEQWGQFNAEGVEGESMLMPEGDARFVAAEGDFQARWIEHIRVKFGDRLGPDAALLDTPEGLQALSRKILRRLRGSYAGVWETFPDILGG